MTRPTIHVTDLRRAAGILGLLTQRCEYKNNKYNLHNAMLNMLGRNAGDLIRASFAKGPEKNPYFMQQCVNNIDSLLKISDKLCFGWPDAHMVDNQWYKSLPCPNSAKKFDVCGIETYHFEQYGVYTFEMYGVKFITGLRTKEDEIDEGAELFHKLVHIEIV